MNIPLRCKSKPMKNWVPLESNPETLTEYARKLGMPESVEFHELLSFEDWAVEMIPTPVKAAIFLYPLTSEDIEAPLVDDSVSGDSFFTRQTIGNACGTIALLHVLANSSYTDGSFVDVFVKQSQGKSFLQRGRLLEDSKELEALHSSVASGEADDVDTHFIAFIEKAGNLIELDGRKAGPVNHGACRDFLPSLIQLVKTRYIETRPDEVRFSLIALA